MIAILSDIHGNLEALEAVLDDMAAFNVTRIDCLGDLIGFGPDPIPCIEHAMSWNVVLRGNFDHAAVSEDDFSGWTAIHAAETVRQFRVQLQLNPNSAAITNFLSALPLQFTVDEALYVHGSPRNPLYEYLFPEDFQTQRKMDAQASLFGPLCFCGHTHIPGIFRQKGPAWEFITPEQCRYSYPLSGDKVICNVGSVGQPRDGDSRACYVLWSPDSIKFRRVDYNLDLTGRKIFDLGWDDFLGDRLRRGS